MAEAELRMLEQEMNNPALQSNPEKSQQMAAAYAAKEQEITARYEAWAEITGD